MELASATALWLANPFADVEASEREAARSLLLRRPAETLVGLLAAGDGLAADRFLIAVGHAQALAAHDAPRTVLSAPLLPAQSLQRAPRPRAEYLPVLMAAARCHRVLQSLHGCSGAMQRLRRDVWSAAFGASLWHGLALRAVIRDHDVLVRGETGTGKEIVARALLEAGPGGRDGSRAPAEAINAAAVPDTLIDSELFGHVRGAFTGAQSDRRGRIRSAHGGCFFLDEVGDLPLPSQVKLLRVIETNMVNPVGSDRDEPADVRYIAATHKPLRQMVEAGSFREDLYNRIADRVIHLPPLRERPEDIEVIGRAFVEHYLEGREEFAAARERVERFLASPEARRHHWPGNVRELQNVLRGLLLGMPPSLRSEEAPPRTSEDMPPAIAAGNATLQEAGDWYLRRVLARTGGNYTETARILAVDRSTVRRRAQ